MKIRLYTIFACCFLFLSLSMHAQNMYESKEFQAGFMNECIKNASAGGFTKEEASKYCSCTFDKMKAQNLSVDELKSISNPNSDAFKSIVLPCVEEAKKNTSKKSVQETPIAAPSPEEVVTTDADLPTVSLADGELTESMSDQSVSSMLASTNDIFMKAANFNFRQARFANRGYYRQSFTTMLNGIVMNSAADGVASFGDWGGLNDVMRNRENSIYLDRSTFSFGGPGGTQNIDTRAGSQRKGLNISYAGSNTRMAQHRVMASYSSGFLKNGLAISFSISHRWTTKGYIPGTSYDGTSYFLSLEGKINAKHRLAFAAIGASTYSAGTRAAVRESQTLAKDIYYNPNWGFQNGEVRAANVNRRFQPILMVTHEAKFSNATSWITGASFQFGKSKRSGLDWYNSANPSPDYYRNLPSNLEDPTDKELATDILQTNEAARQIQWDNFYASNRSGIDSVKDANGIAGNTVIGKRSKYIVSDRVNDQLKFNFNSTFNHTVNNNVFLTAGLTYQFEKSRNYHQVTDLLGGDFYVDLNQFAVLDFPTDPSKSQNNIDKPNRILKVGDQYDYDFNYQIHKSTAWLQPSFTFKKVDFFFGGSFTNTYFWRTGLVRNGVFPTSSYGDSEKSSFYNFAVKGGLSVKIDGRNYLFANATYRTDAPAIRNSYISATTRNDLIPNLKSQTTYGGEIGYQYKAPRISGKAVFFYTQFENMTERYSFYHDDYRSIVNYSLTNVNQRHLGGEVAVEGKIYKGLTATFAGNFGKYTYNSQPNALVTKNNSADVIYPSQKTYLKNYNVGGQPQLATTLGLRYVGKQYWSVGINFNYFDWMWVTVNPIRRTADAVDLVPENSAKWHEILDQEKLKGQFTMDLNANYSWNLGRQFKKLAKTGHNYYLNFNASINNLTNNRKFIIRGQEQLRFDYNEKNVQKFASRYQYMTGIGFYLSVNFRFQ